MKNMDMSSATRGSHRDRWPSSAATPPLFSPEDLDRAFDEAARSGLHTPEALERMRRHGGIRPATGPWRDLPQPVKLTPRWLAFLLRMGDRLTGRRPFFD
jgi:hypothetical protein